MDDDEPATGPNAYVIAIQHLYAGRVVLVRPINEDGVAVRVHWIELPPGDLLSVLHSPDRRHREWALVGAALHMVGATERTN